MPAPCCRRLMVVGEQPLHRFDGVAGTGKYVEHHGVVHAELRGQRLGRCVAEPLERAVRPVDGPFGSLLPDDLPTFLGSSPALISAFRFSITCSGAITTTSPTVS